MGRLLRREILLFQPPLLPSLPSLPSSLSSPLLSSPPSSSYLSSSSYSTSFSSSGGGTPTTWGHVHNWKIRAKIEKIIGEEKEQEQQGRIDRIDTSEENIIRLDDNLEEGVLEEYFESFVKEVEEREDPKKKKMMRKKRIDMEKLFG